MNIGRENLSQIQTITNKQKNNGSKALIFLENGAQVRDSLQWMGNINGEKKIIALSPFAMYELDKHGISYKIQEDYYKTQELYEMGMGNFQKVEEMCTIIDDIILKSCSSAKQRNVTPALFNFYHLKMMYDAMTIRIFQLKYIFNVEKPDIVYIYDTKKYPFGCHENAPFIQFDNRESLYAQILALESWKVNVKIIQSGSIFEKQALKKKDNRVLFKNFKNHIFSRLLSHPELSDLAMVINKRGIPGLFNWLKYNLYPNGKHACIALLGAGYNWDDSIIELKAKQIGPIYRLHYGFRELINLTNRYYKDLDDAWIELINNQDFLKFFVYDNIDFFLIIRERLLFLVNHLTIACIISACNTESLIKKRKIKAFIAPMISNCLEHSVAKVAHNSGIPVITWQHGAYGAMRHQIINYIDLINSDFHFVFGEGVAKQYAKSAKLFDTKLVPIGSSVLEGLQAKHSNDKCVSHGKKSILYITSSGYQNNLYISHYPPFSDNLFLKTQKAIVDTLGKYEDYSIILKLHPSFIYKKIDIYSYINEKSFKNFQVIKNETSITELLSLVDIIVIDIPSTTLLQALITTKPICVYLGHAHFDANAHQLLETRAVCHEGLEDFISELDEYLQTKKNSKDLFNKEFLEMFGTTSENSFAAEKAAKKLRQIIDSYDVNK